MRGADLLVQTLAVAGVTRIYSLSGNQIMPVYDACIDAGIEIVHTRHEAAAVFMADAHAQLTGQIGVALVTAAPGAANAVGALFSARQSESPVLLLTGDSPRGQDGKGAFQELDQIPMTAPLTKASVRAATPTGLGEDIARALRTALSGRPGPVHIALPFDVVEGDAGTATPPAAATMARSPAAPADTDIRAIAARMAEAQAPLILCGPSMNATRTGGMHDALVAALDAPVIAMESPRGLRDPALGDLAGVLGAADLIVCLGKPVNFMVGFGAEATCPKARWIVLDTDPAEHDRARLNLGDRLVHAVLADPRDGAAALIAAGTNTNDRTAWRTDVKARLTARSFPTDDLPTSGPISSAALSATVQRRIAANPDTVLICDGGEFGQWAQAITQASSRITNGPSGAIGGGLCFALAASKARPGAPVFALMGDGTSGFHFAEFETAAREGTPFVAIIGNDECWNAEHQIQMRSYGPDRLIGCQLSGARYDLAVAAFGGHGEYVTDMAGLDAALDRAIASGKVACVNVAIEGKAAPGGPGH